MKKTKGNGKSLGRDNSGMTATHSAGQRGKGFDTVKKPSKYGSDTTPASKKKG